LIPGAEEYSSSRSVNGAANSKELRRRLAEEHKKAHQLAKLAVRRMSRDAMFDVCILACDRPVWTV
jgi:hypothetical protein